MSEKVQLQDIADAMGVTVSTVSSILNGYADKRRISKALTHKVLQKAQELNYRPNFLAQSLRSGKSRIIGLILPDVYNSTFLQISRTIEKLAVQNNYCVMTCHSRENDNNPESLINSLIDHRMDGFIIAPTTKMKPAFFRILEHSKIPFVIIDRYIPDQKTYQIALDNFQLGYLPTEHFINQGLERIALVIHQPDLKIMKDRISGYEEALRKYDIRVRPPFIRFIPNENYQQATAEAIDHLLDWRPPVEGIILLSNTVSLPALERLCSRKVRIPDDLKIIAMDSSPYFPLMNPSISAMTFNISEMAEKAFNTLMQLIDTKEIINEPKIETIPVSLIIRESSVNKNK
jgi:LacI family transcriptional regulator